MTTRIIAKISDEIGGDTAVSTLPEEWEGAAKLVYDGSCGRYCAVFPSLGEAVHAASYAITPDGGYSNVEVIEPDRGETVTHLSAQDWIFE